MKSRVSSVATTLVYGTLLAAVPAALIHQAGPPELDLPSADAVQAFIRQPLTRGFILALAHGGAWLIWGLLAATTAVRGYHRLARALRWLPALRLPGPLQHLAAVLLGATAVTATGGLPAHAVPGTATTSDTPHPPTRSADQSTPTATRAAARTSDAPTTYTVARGDTLSAIAQRCLGDDDRWPEIFALNRGTHFADVGGTLRDPDLIHPGWTLDLPADATAPASRQPRPAPPGPSATTQTNPASPTTPATGAPPSAGPPATATPHAPTSEAPTAGQSPSSTAGAPAAAGEADTTGAVPDSDTTGKRPARGVSLPSGSWIDVGLALAIAAAVALLWAHRQRRHVPRKPFTTPRLDDPDLAPMPHVVGQIRRALRRAAAQPDTAAHSSRNPRDDEIDDQNRASSGGDAAQTAASETIPDRAAALPVAPALAHPLWAVWPPAGLGLTGPGAHAAARGFLTAALAAGGADHPDARTQVVMTSATAATLLGAAAVGLPRTPRLTVTAGLDDALRILEEQTLHRTRLVYRHEVDTVTELRAADPHEEPLAPVMLLADTTGHRDRARIAALLAQGQRLDIHGVLLGPWPDGHTVDVAAGGTTTPADGDTRDGSHPADVGRLAVLNPTETTDLLTTLAESHTGKRAPAEPAPRATATMSGSPVAGDTADSVPPPPATAADLPATHTTADGADDRHVPVASADRTAGTTLTASHPATEEHPSAGLAAASGEQAAAATHTARDAKDANPLPVRVLGPPGVVDGDPQRTPRAKSLELLVYLAVHNATAPAEAILDDLLPDAPTSKAPGRLYTYVSGLRALLRHNGGPGSYVTHPDHRYQLNRDLLDVDLWRMRTAIRDAAHATEPQARTAALRRAVDAYTGPLADGCDYEWVEPYREAVRQEALDAHLALTDTLTGQPAQQLRVLDAAIAHNPHHEPLYQAAMRARAQLGDINGIRALRRTVTRRLAEIDAEPSDGTLTLADRLVADLRHPGRASGAHRPHDTDGAPA
ncbi:LysM peptidoglycan-binding domain-containing protein [Micromonospora peucetia]|uniref:BTAD domain-containing putative transcriptional regulator n=1 Tax=Micromonospora peucetia TaxID=47871 RepID=UPI002254D7AA|nr:BTAD domain-containing putative transcriptional regulator [Micromonospora peucetia]MCX4387293.1 LysM peptidoglycan-binding domain-containing protein [Micromonospora peucetia]